jgi:sugar/nucleoside kinase (ribokinase family)
MTFVVIGDLMADVVAAHDAPLAHGSDTAAHTRLQGGGGGGNVAAWLAEAGADVALVGRVGDDALADVALVGLERVDLRVARGGRTGICVVLVGPDGERTMLPDAGANDALQPEDLPAELFVPDNVLYLSGYTLLRDGSRPAAHAALARAREHNMAIVLDAASAAPLAAAPTFTTWAGAVDLLLANEDEIGALGNGCDAREIVTKRGPAGAMWTDGSRTVAVKAQSVDVVDTTGAGDAFAAGFLAVWHDGPERALASGAALASRAVGLMGGHPE